MIPINKQQIEKRVESNGAVLSVHSVFYTLQGEGMFTGWPCVFVRLAGCNLQCPSCDTEYTEGRKEMAVSDILDQVWDSFPEGFRKEDRLVVVTGGEPLRQNLDTLLLGLNDLGIHSQIETNGTMPSTKTLRDLSFCGDVTVVCSPKAGMVNQSMYPVIDAYKYVLDEASQSPDGMPSAAHNHTVGPKGLARPHKGFEGIVYLQPMDPKHDARYLENVRLVKESCLTHGYVLQLQLHKIVGVD